MLKRSILIACVVAGLSFVSAAVSLAADAPAKKEGLWQKTRSFIHKIFSYPANVIQGSVDVVADTGKSAAGVVTKEVKTAGEAVTGDADKAKELVTGPLTGTAETVVEAVKDIAEIPVEAAKE